MFKRFLRQLDWLIKGPQPVDLDSTAKIVAKKGWKGWFREFYNLKYLLSIFNFKR